MKNTRIFVLLAVAALIFSTAAFAQSQDQNQAAPERRGPGGPGGPGFGRGGPRGGMLPPSLNLTADQKAQVESIRKEERDAMKNLDEQALTGAQRREQMQQIRQGTQQKIEAILTPDQKAKLAAERAKHPGGPGGPGGQRRQPPPQQN